MEELARGMAVSRRKNGWVIDQQVGKRKIRLFRPSKKARLYRGSIPAGAQVAGSDPPDMLVPYEGT